MATHQSDAGFAEVEDGRRTQAAGRGPSDTMGNGSQTPRGHGVDQGTGQEMDGLHRIGTGIGNEYKVVKRPEREHMTWAHIRRRLAHLQWRTNDEHGFWRQR